MAVVIFWVGFDYAVMGLGMVTELLTFFYWVSELLTFFYFAISKMGFFWAVTW